MQSMENLSEDDLQFHMDSEVHHKDEDNGGSHYFDVNRVRGPVSAPVSSHGTEELHVKRFLYKCQQSYSLDDLSVKDSHKT